MRDGEAARVLPVGEPTMLLWDARDAAELEAAGAAVAEDVFEEFVSRREPPMLFEARLERLEAGEVGDATELEAVPAFSAVASCADREVDEVDVGWVMSWPP